MIANYLCILIFFNANVKQEGMNLYTVLKVCLHTVKIIFNEIDIFDNESINSYLWQQIQNIDSATAKQTCIIWEYLGKDSQAVFKFTKTDI